MYSPTAEVLPWVRHTACMADAESRLRPKVCLQWGGEASEYCPSPLPPPQGSCLLSVRVFPFLHKTWINLCEAAAGQKLRHPRNLPSVPAAPVAPGHRSSLYGLEGERFFTIMSRLLARLTFLKPLERRCHCAAEEDHPLVTSAFGDPGQRPDLLLGMNSGQD